LDWLGGDRFSAHGFHTLKADRSGDRIRYGGKLLEPLVFCRRRFPKARDLPSARLYEIERTLLGLLFCWEWDCFHESDFRYIAVEFPFAILGIRLCPDTQECVFLKGGKEGCKIVPMQKDEPVADKYLDCVRFSVGPARLDVMKPGEIALEVAAVVEREMAWMRRGLEKVSRFAKRTFHNIRPSLPAFGLPTAGGRPRQATLA
jgi:hypothetical protein